MQRSTTITKSPNILNKETKVLNCATPPKKEILIQLVKEELNKRGERRTFSVDKNHTPDAIYLITLLGSLNPNHAIFAKDYLPDQKIEAKIAKELKMKSMKTIRSLL